ncbi:hypothetical protein LPB19_00145 [Marinobacter salinisoli]|uniref:DUF5666 domain-containing protein n=1 Tax=Marinobacter salinisoli TaxID=2769486 RepID=A0ABX7MRF4_9GAMM|nr:DUF5666 domain-containing protein [Marinobacter salinisoli]QSP94876.1 hypothetical protein LPB19_00145 [Marinobacter salinisoli]
MKRKPIAIAVKLIMTGSLVGALAACGGGGSGDSASNGSSSGSSVGAVSGFGSVYVNGTRFETDGSVVSNDGLSREDQLEKGMILKIDGDWSDQGEGRADQVTYDDTLRGPVSAMTWDEVSGTGTLTLLGQSVLLDSKTVFRGATPTDIAGNATGYRVRVSGWRMADGSVQASYVGAQIIGDDFDDANEVEIQGVVADLDTSAQTFTINGALINYTSATGDDDFALDDLADGIVVEVEGFLDGTTIMAEEIDDEDELFNNDDDVEISGSIYDFDVASGQFSLDGIRVQINSDTEFDDLDEDSLANGLFVKVEGEAVNGVLVAEEIEGRESDAELDGRIESIDLNNETMVVSGVRVQLTGNTLIDDDDSGEDGRRSRARDLESLQLGDFLEIEGRQRSEEGGFLEAISIEREDSDEDDDFELDARISAIGADSITIMNLEVLSNNFSLSGAQVGDEVEIDYRQTTGGQYELTGNVEVEGSGDSSED